ncbi:MAG: FecR family protein [Cyclobacteriaceae bacterium]
MAERNKHIEDLLLDASFVAWVKKPDYESDLYWTQWLSRFPEREQELMIAKEVVQRMRFKVRKPSEEDTHHNFRNTMHILEHDKNNQNNNIKKVDFFWHFNYYAKIAAVILALITSLVVVYHIHTSNIILVDDNESIAKIITKSTPVVVKTQTQLPDGTMVWLNAASSLSYPDTFGEFREVHLTGEAYFEVVEDIHKPFIVKTNFSEVQVLGTSFNVNAYGENDSELISLESGKVEIKTKNEESLNILSPGQQLIYSKALEKSTVTIFNTEEVSGWKDGLLVFKNATMNQIIGKLERWYGVEIELQNKPADDWRVNGYFQDQPLDLVLSRLSFSKDFEYEMEGKKVKIRFL